MSGFKSYLTTCTGCHGTTSKAYARRNEGRCKSCVTGQETPRGARGSTYRRTWACEDAPCCGCCGPQGDGDYYGYDGSDR